MGEGKVSSTLGRGEKAECICKASTPVWFGARYVEVEVAYEGEQVEKRAKGAHLWRVFNFERNASSRDWAGAGAGRDQVLQGRGGEGLVLGRHMCWSRGRSGQSESDEGRMSPREPRQQC